MYGTIAKLQIKPDIDIEAESKQFIAEFEAANVPGYIGEYIYRMDSDPNEYYMVVMFESKEAYHANATSPEQHKRYETFRSWLSAEPDWHDGEVVFSHRQPR